ncbi:hypothetical protein GCM10015535_30610 [Streptomyces gelaticus]|uniref:Uncharacterized protein n=1 Tax=Streptomyces gelaticus TaxID=285446 RepID=A0ABQ2VYB2_9ACTN|nr:hypothetical protein GCM10015535_30610 [Streptomyces gelaticus]
MTLYLAQAAKESPSAGYLVPELQGGAEMKRRSITSVLAFTAVAGSLLVAPSATASEVRIQKADCEVWKSSKAPWTGYSKCTGMLPLVERQQVKVICIDPRGSQWVVYGRGKGNGETSSAKCSDNPNVGVYKVGANVYRI